MESPETVHGVSSPGRSSAELKRKTFSETRTPSIHGESQNENRFFRKADILGKNDHYTADVLSEINGQDEGIADTDISVAPGHANAPRVAHSMSAPAGHHKPLKKSSFDSDSNFHRGKSLQEAKGLSRDEDDDENKPAAVDCNSITARRESYKDSAYGGSEGSTETCNTDDGLPVEGQKRRLSLKVSKDLGTVAESLEHLSDTDDVSVPKTHRPLSEATKARRESYNDSAYAGSEGSTETCNTDDVSLNDGPKRRLSQQKGSKDLGTVAETLEHFSATADVSVPKPDRPLSEQKTPDFDVLQPRSVCSSESSGSSHSETDPTSATPRTPGLHPLFEELGLRSTSSMGSVDQPDLSPQRFDMDKEDYVFHNEYPAGASEHLDIASLEPSPSMLSLGPCLRRDWSRSADGSESPILPPGDPVSLPSVGNLPMSEADLRQMFQRCRHSFQIQHIIRSMKRGEPFENIVALTRFMSDPDHSSDFSSIGSATHSLHSSSSGSMSDHIPGINTMPLAPHLATINSVDSGRSVELYSQYESRSCDAELSVSSFDSEGKLERAACCRQSRCTDEQCQEGQKLILYIERFLDQSSIHTRYHDNIILRTIAEHASLCDELKCPIPWCTFFLEHDLPFEDQVANLHAAYFSGQISMTSEDSEVNKVELLARSLDCGCKEHVDWSGIARLGGYGNAVLAMTSSLDNPAYWVVKKENKDVLLHVDVLRKLKGKFHPRIVQHLWILEQENSLFIASKFEGASVADRMSESGQTGLPKDRVLKYMEQLASATQFLQRENVNIAYLNWTAENILISTDMRFVKLCNFSCAVLIEEIHDDEERLEDLKLLLPPRIVPPELYQGQTVDTTSDVWGLGCVWYQMTTGHLLYLEYCHFHPATVRDKLEDGPEPDLTEVPENLRTDLSQCLQMDPGARITTPNLHTRLIQLGT